MEWFIITVVPALGLMLIMFLIMHLLISLTIKRVKTNFDIDTGMSYEQIFEKLGEPFDQKEKKNQTIYRWKLETGKKKMKIRIAFIQEIATKIFI